MCRAISPESVPLFMHSTPLSDVNICSADKIYDSIKGGQLICLSAHGPADGRVLCFCVVRCVDGHSDRSTIMKPFFLLVEARAFV